MKFEIKRRYDHYELFVNERFYGSYDTVKEAADEIDRISEERAS